MCVRGGGGGGGAWLGQGVGGGVSLCSVAFTLYELRTVKYVYYIPSSTFITTPRADLLLAALW